MTFLVTATVESRIKDFAGLVGLVLVLVTLFTNQRATTLRELRGSPKAKQPDATQEMGLLALLLVVTVLLFLCGLPIVHAAATHWHPRASAGPLRAAFTLSWILLLGVIAWQAVLLNRARQLRAKLPSE